MTDAERKERLDAIVDRLIAAMDAEFKTAVDDARGGVIPMEVFLASISAVGCTAAQGVGNVLGMLDNLGKSNPMMKPVANEVAARVKKNLEAVLSAHRLRGEQARSGGGL